jgi:hypothetical protein
VLTFMALLYIVMLPLGVKNYYRQKQAYQERLLSEPREKTGNRV